MLKKKLKKLKKNASDPEKKAIVPTGSPPPLPVVEFHLHTTHDK